MPRTIPNEVTASELAKICGRTDDWVRKQAQDGVFVRAGRGRYALAASISGFVNANSDRGRKTSAESEAKARVAERKARLLDMQIAERERELIPMTEALGTVDDIVGALLTGLSALPARIAGRDMAGRQKVVAAVDEMRTELANRMQAFSAAASGKSLPAVGGDEDGGEG